MADSFGFMRNIVVDDDATKREKRLVFSWRTKPQLQLLVFRCNIASLMIQLTHFQSMQQKPQEKLGKQHVRMNPKEKISCRPEYLCVEIYSKLFSSNHLLFWRPNIEYRAHAIKGKWLGGKIPCLKFYTQNRKI